MVGANRSSRAVSRLAALRVMTSWPSWKRPAPLRSPAVMVDGPPFVGRSFLAPSPHRPGVGRAAYPVGLEHQELLQAPGRGAPGPGAGPGRQPVRGRLILEMKEEQECPAGSLVL